MDALSSHGPVLVGVDLEIAMVPDSAFDPGKEFFPNILVLGIAVYMVVPQRLTILVKMHQRFNDLSPIIIILVRCSVKCTVDLQPPIGPLLQCGSQLELL